MKTLGERIKYLRTQKGLSMDALRKALVIPLQDEDEDEELIGFARISTATISNLENNKHKPTSDIVVALSRFFNVSCDWLLTGKEFKYEPLSEEAKREAEEAAQRITQMLERIKIEQELLTQAMVDYQKTISEIRDK